MIQNLLCHFNLCPHQPPLHPRLQDSGFLHEAFESQNAAVMPLSRLLYDELVKSILRIVEKLDLSVQKVTAGEEVRCDSAANAIINLR